MDSIFSPEFLTVALVHFLAVASPGPDFAIVLKQSINQGRRAAILTSIGIATGILVHVTYSLVGVGLIIASTPILLTILKYIAASYFLYIAWHGLRAKPPNTADNQTVESRNATESGKKSFMTGFLINALNIKATLFFVALFSIVIDTSTQLETRVMYGVYMTFATGVWFCSLSYMLSTKKVRTLLVSKGYWLDRAMGLILLLLAADLVMSEISMAV